MPATPPVPAPGVATPAVEAPPSGSVGPFLRPPDTDDVAYEFFAPFAHVPGKYEWCRIRSPTHGVFDCFILLAQSTSVAASVYVGSTLGAAFMRERYPECSTFHVAPSVLRIEESNGGRTVTGTLSGAPGPVTNALMTLRASTTSLPKQVPYGGEGQPVWGSRFTCWGVDLTLDALCDGVLEWADGRKEMLRGTKAIVTVGSFGRIAPLGKKA